MPLKNHILDYKLKFRSTIMNVDMYLRLAPQVLTRQDLGLLLVRVQDFCYPSPQATRANLIVGHLPC